MKLKSFFLVCLVMTAAVMQSKAQRLASYTVLQAGGLFGVQTTSRFDPMSGYQFQFVFGKHIEERTFFGLGIGNDVYRGKTMVNENLITNRKMNVLPIFADFRQKVFDVSILSNVGVLANAGYAPGLGGDYHRGFMGKVGLTYTHLLSDQSNLQLSLGYGLQQFDSRYLLDKFRQQQIFLTVGLLVL